MINWTILIDQAQVELRAAVEGNKLYAAAHIHDAMSDLRAALEQLEEDE
jgi:hypothetical protein